MISIMRVDLSPLFDGGFSRVLYRDESLFLTGTPVRSMFLVTEGQVDLIRHTESGLRILLYRAEVGDVLAEASAYSEAYHCDGTAAGPAQVRSIALPTFRARLDGNLGLGNAWAERLAHGLQGSRMNAAIRSMRTVEERLEAWLANGKALPPKGQWQGVAEALGVSREALYRELSRRHDAD
jgi:CRP-like cAMP-binding protein